MYEWEVVECVADNKRIIIILSLFENVRNNTRGVRFRLLSQFFLLKTLRQINLYIYKIIWKRKKMILSRIDMKRIKPICIVIKQISHIVAVLQRNN
jgi:hypothetical protein